MSDAAKYSAVEALRDGRRAEIRALRPDDRAKLIAALGRSSAESFYRREIEPGPLEHPQHRDVFRQDLGDQFQEPGAAADGGEMAHQRRPDALALVLVDDRERYLGLPGLDDDVAPASDDRPPSSTAATRAT